MRQGINVYSADGSVEERQDRKRRKNGACKTCRHPWSEHQWGKECHMRKRSGQPAPNHRASCGCSEFKDPPKKRRQAQKKVLFSW